MHSLKPGNPNGYIDILKSAASSFKMFSKFYLGYAIGASSLPKEGPSSDILSLTGDLMNPFIGIENPDDLIQFYA